MRTIPALAVLALLVPALALAQDAAPRLEDDPRAAKFKDVERGFFVGFEAGYMGLLKTPTVDREKFPLAGTGGGRATGMLLGALVGVDLGRYLAVAVYGQYGSPRASPDYGAFSLYGAGVDVKVGIPGPRDVNDWDRLYLFVHGRGGYAKTSPEGLFGTSENVFAAGVGVEYYTRLRHFSIALGADGIYASKAKASGWAVYPTIRYTF